MLHSWSNALARSMSPVFIRREKENTLRERMTSIMLRENREMGTPQKMMAPKKETGTPQKTMGPKKETDQALDSFHLVMAPKKAGRIQVSNFTEKKCQVLLAADSLQSPKTNLNYSGISLRCCPKFENMSHSGDEASTTMRKEMKGHILSSSFADGDRDESPKYLNYSLHVERTKERATANLESKKRVDLFSREIADDYQDEDDDTCILGSNYGVMNTRCPLSGKLVTELEDPVQSVNCRHIYDQAVVKTYINQSSGTLKCPVAGCPKSMIVSDLVCNTSLTESIQDLRQKDSTNKLKLSLDSIHIDDD